MARITVKIKRALIEENLRLWINCFSSVPAKSGSANPEYQT
jgi:hypothetical protein